MIRDNFGASVTQLKAAVQLDFNSLMCAADFPGIAIAQPVVGLLLLPPVHERLAKHAVLIAQTVARGRELHSCNRIEEARSEATKPSVSQSRIRFLLDQLEPIKIILPECLPMLQIEL